jgi:DNA-binding beta-propeller fold protein YncE
VSIIDVENPTVEAARVRVGTDSPSGQTRPFIPSFTPDGKEIVVPNFRANNVSIVDLHAALADPAKGEVARIALTRPDGGPARPKGSAVTADGRYAVISGGARVIPNTVASGTVWVIDLRKRAVVATVTGVGNDPYGLAVVDLKGHDRDED